MKIFQTSNEVKVTGNKIHVQLMNYRHGLTWAFFTSVGSGFGEDKRDAYMQALKVVTGAGMIPDWSAIPSELEIDCKPFELAKKRKTAKLDALDKEQERRAAFRAFRREMKREGLPILSLKDIQEL